MIELGAHKYPLKVSRHLFALTEKDVQIPTVTHQLLLCDVNTVPEIVLIQFLGWRNYHLIRNLIVSVLIKFVKSNQNLAYSLFPCYVTELIPKEIQGQKLFLNFL